RKRITRLVGHSSLPSSKVVALCHDSVAIATFLFTKYAVSRACCANIACRQVMNYAAPRSGFRAIRCTRALSARDWAWAARRSNYDSDAGQHKQLCEWQAEQKKGKNHKNDTHDLEMKALSNCGNQEHCSQEDGDAYVMGSDL